MAVRRCALVERLGGLVGSMSAGAVGRRSRADESADEGGGGEVTAAGEAQQGAVASAAGLWAG